MLLLIKNKEQNICFKTDNIILKISARTHVFLLGYGNYEKIR